MITTYTEADFESMSWHDCPVWGIELRAGDFDEGDWTSDLALKLDFIVEWYCDRDRTCQWRIAPATLVFHGVTDLKIDIAMGNGLFQLSAHEIIISEIRRERIYGQNVFLDRPYYCWRVESNCPKGGVISFGAVGLTQTLHAAPIVAQRQRLSAKERLGMVAD
jgi:hypothetical protein